MKKETIPYLINSASIIKNDFYPLIIIGMISTAFLFQYIHQNFLLIILGYALMFFFYPAVYGQYTEITLNRRMVSYKELFKKHVLNYFIVSLCLGFPMIVLLAVRMIFEVHLAFLELIVSILTSILSIYILPLLFIHGRRWQSIKIGVQCVVGNFSFTLPLILITSLSTILLYVFNMVKSDSTYIFGMVYFLFWILGMVIDFWIFVSAILILRDKGLADQRLK